MLFDFIKWMFMNLMVAIGVAFLTRWSPVRGLLKRVPYPWPRVAGACVMALFCMLYPWFPAPGTMLDLRMAPMTLVGLSEGWDKAIPVGLVIIAYRAATAGPLAQGTVRAVLWVSLAIAVLPFFDRRPRTVWRVALVGLLHALLGWSLSFIPYLSGGPLGVTSPYWPVFTVVIVLSLLLLNAAIEYVQEKQVLQAKLQEELRVNEAVLELLPYGILFLDAQHQMTACNGAARGLLAEGQTPAQWLAHPEVDQALRAHRRISGCRIAYPVAEGVERIVLLSAAPLPSGGAVLGVQNVTGVIEAEREEAQRSRLEFLGQLAATAAHEIKNPLTTIKGFLQLLSPRPEFEAHRPIFALVRGEVEQINRVVTDFLGLAGRPVLDPQRLALDDLLDEVLRLLQVQFPGHAVEMRLEGTPGLTVDADRNALKHVLQNLAANAFEAMPSGGRMVVRRDQTETGVCIAVSDTGPGIAPDLLPLIFTPYVTTKATGTGLGLAIAQKLATEMGSRLRVVSELGKGSTFFLDLPA
ncbi:MAG: two-component system sensor histidine kinase NtrB [Mycobacterium leprae]